MDPMSTPANPQEPNQAPPEEKVIGFCRTCGRPLTEATKRAALGTVFCDEHAPNVNAAPSVEPPSPYAIPPGSNSSDGSPALAFLLGFIPGVGAIYNGQYAKGLVHVLVFGLLVSMLKNDAVNGFEAMFGLLLAAFVFYQCFEAYHTAQRKAAGQPIDEFSGLLPGTAGSRGLPIAPVLLIVLGIFFLLGNLGLLHLYQVMRFWPVILIAIGLFLLMSRVRGEVNDEQR